ncbi:ninja-family protein AFP2-like [Euphorbia lathyris]|uniref:ninja-family protein AFP2-like n=1 Tax=Euphorbia lathyris TaxID=212925 RepID=UPI0033136D4E
MVGEDNETRNNRSSSSSSNSKTMENLSLEINRYPRDLLQRLSSTDVHQFRTTAASEGEEEEEIELNLGLSLGGRFGVDKTAKNLKRSSSIAGSIPLLRNHDSLNTPPASYPVLMRTSSLPTETEEEWRKRKEMQSLRRMEAKRRRSEKQKNSNSNSSSRGEFNLEEEKRGVNANRVPNWIRQANRGNTLQVWVGQQQGSQGSLESQGGSSSGISEMDSKPAQGLNSVAEARSPGSSQSLQDRSNQETSGTKANENTNRTPKPEMDSPSKKLDSAGNKGREIGTNAVENMPCVFTIGEGPNGRRVEGILYKYGKGEEVRIMCVCHGNFLSPAEFVKHAGGVDVDHPLRHIVVNTSASSGGSFL